MKSFLKKTLPLSLIILLLALSSQAQFYTGSRGVGITGAFNLSDLRYLLGSDDAGTKADTRLSGTLRLGIVAEYATSDIVSLQTGLVYAAKGATLKRESNQGDISYKMKPKYLEIPLNLFIKPQINFNTNFYFGVGPYLAFPIGGKGELSGNDIGSQFYSDHKLKFGTKASKDMRGVDFGFNFSAGIEFNSSVMLGLQYGLGITNLAPEKNPEAPLSLKNRILSLSLSTLIFQGYR